MEPRENTQNNKRTDRNNFIGIWRKVRWNSGNCRMTTYPYYALRQMDY